VSGPIDAVYTWVDDSFPGYAEQLARYATDRHDRNPNRTRDNLDMLRYSLRSLEAYAPWIRRVYLVSCRPQVPAWLDPSAVTVVHHDQVIDERYLPTFNSFTIASHLYRIPGLSERFLYVEDDYLFGRPVAPDDWVRGDRFRLWTKREGSPGGDQRERDVGPWNRAVAHANYLLDRAYRPEPRRMVRHAPLLIDRALYGAMVERWADDFQHTWASRFRALGNVAPEHLYPYYLWYEGRSSRVPLVRSYVDGYYQGIDNVVPQQIVQFAYLRWLRPKLYCLNDNFDARPSPFVVRLTRRYLAEAYPRPSRFERHPAGSTA
jgi:hypothetical protein